MIPKDINTWTSIEWKERVAYCRPSSGGAVGVVFVWLNSGGSKRAAIRGGVGDSYKNSEASFVIKPIQGSAAPTKFAEHLLGEIAGASSPHSKPILRSSMCGVGLGSMLRNSMSMEFDATVKGRWREVYTHYHNAETFLIQETQVFLEMADEYRKEGGLREILGNKKLMYSLGKLFAADAIIGNGDRLFRLNTGNIFFKPDGKISSIDSATILTNYQKVMDTAKTEIGTSFGLPETTAGWAKAIYHKDGSVQTPTLQQQEMFGKTRVMLAPSFGVNTVFNVDHWWSNEFQRVLSSKAPDKLDGTVWDTAKEWFREGVNDGLKAIDRKLSGFNWSQIKKKYNTYITKYGGDSNLDWTNFKIRRRYFRLRKDGCTEAEAMTDIQQYAKYKLHKESTK